MEENEGFKVYAKICIQYFRLSAFLIFSSFMLQKVVLQRFRFLASSPLKKAPFAVGLKNSLRLLHLHERFNSIKFLRLHYYLSTWNTYDIIIKALLRRQRCKK